MQIDMKETCAETYEQIDFSVNAKKQKNIILVFTLEFPVN